MTQTDADTNWQAEPHQLRAILEGLLEGLLVFRLDGQLLHLNAAARELYNLSEQSGGAHRLSVHRVTNYSHMDGTAVAADATPAARVLRGESFTGYELWAHAAEKTRPPEKRRAPRPDEVRGERRWLGSYSGTQVQDSVTLGVLSVRDVTAEYELEARFRATFEINPTAISIVRLADLRFSDVNESFLALSGYTRDEVIGASATDLKLFSDSEKRDAAVRLLQRQQTDRVTEHEARLQTKTGEQRQVLSEGRLIFFGGTPYLVDTYLDITERKRSEGELMRAIQETMADPTWFTRVVMKKLAEIRAGGQVQPGLEQLTPREQRVLELLAQGWGNGQIAQELELSRHTVRNYVATIYAKLGVKSRAEAVIWARERGLIFPV